MHCLVIQRDKKVILISACSDSAHAGVEEVLLQRCEKYIEEAGYEMIDVDEGAPSELAEWLAYYEKQGYAFQRYVEMDMILAEYQLPDMVVPGGVSFGFYEGSLEMLHEAVAAVEEDWIQYFTQGCRVFCGFVDDDIASFCIVGYDDDCVIADENVRIGSVGCVGTVPKYREQGIGLRMVALATQELKENGCDRGFIHYTALEKWYARLGYRSFMSFYM